MSRRFINHHLATCKQCRRARESVRLRGCWNTKAQLLGLREQVAYLMSETASRLRAYGVNPEGMSLPARMKKLQRLVESQNPAAAAKRAFREAYNRRD